MIPTTIPTEEIWEGADRFVAMPPGDSIDDITNSAIEPVEMLRGTIEGIDKFRVPFHAVRFKASEADIKRLQEGEPLWLVYFLPYPIPIALSFADELVEG